MAVTVSEGAVFWLVVTATPFKSSVATAVDVVGVITTVVPVAISSMLGATTVIFPAVSTVCRVLAKAGLTAACAVDNTGDTADTRMGVPAFSQLVMHSLLISTCKFEFIANAVLPHRKRHSFVIGMASTETGAVNSSWKVSKMWLVTPASVTRMNSPGCTVNLATGFASSPAARQSLRAAVVRTIFPAAST